MAKKKIFTEGTEDRLPWIKPTTEIPERLAAAGKKADEIAAGRKAEVAAEVDKLNKQAEADGWAEARPRPGQRVPQSSPTGREILPGRFEKLRVNGTPSRQGERERSDLLKNARRATFYLDLETLRDIKALAKRQGSGLSEAVNLACREYVKREGGRQK